MIMKKRMLRMSAGVLAGLCVLAGCTWVLSRTLGTHETLYQGKSLDYWSMQLTNRDAAASNQAVAVLYSDIIPHLTNQMVSDTNDSALRVALIDKLNMLPGIQMEFVGAEQRRVQAVMDLAAFGPRAKPAVPILLKLLKDRSSKEIVKAVPKALKQIDPEAAAKARAAH
jgi:hypothetical protein